MVGSWLWLLHVEQETETDSLEPTSGDSTLTRTDTFILRCFSRSFLWWGWAAYVTCNVISLPLSILTSQKYRTWKSQEQLLDSTWFPLGLGLSIGTFVLGFSNIIGRIDGVIPDISPPWYLSGTQAVMILPLSQFQNCNDTFYDVAFR